MSLHQRIGIDLGRKISTEDGIAWAAAHDVHHIDSQIDLAPNALATMQERAPAIRDAHERAGINLALHTLSGVNVAEISPYMSDAVDQYLHTYIDVAAVAGATWIVVHGGYHFTDGPAHRLGRTAEACRRPCRKSRRHPAARKHEPRARSSRGQISLLDPRRMPLLLSPSKFGQHTLVVHRQPRPSLADRHRGRSASTAFSMPSISPAATRSASPIVVAMSKNICSPATARSTSPPCSNALKAWASRGTTPMPSAAWTTCCAGATILSSRPALSGSCELADIRDFGGYQVE